MKQRKIPLRKCTGCQEMKNKKEMIRIVHNEDGEFFLDATGKKPGRGAYICPNIECLEKAQKLKIERGKENRKQKFIENLMYQKDHFSPETLNFISELS